MLIGTSAQVGVRPAEEYCFLIFVTPVGPYFKGGFCANPYVIVRDVDRAAPLGTGMYKVGGNYAASLRANRRAHEQGYASEFYLMQRRRSMLTSVVQPTSLVSRMILMLLLSQVLSCHL